MKLDISINVKKLISSDPQILGGMPVITGTRIPIARIVFLLKDGYSVENIADQYPHVGLQKIADVIDELITELGDKHASQIS